MQMNAYLSFRGDCEAAFNFYAACLGGTVGQLFRYAGSPMAHDVSADWQNKIMHGSVTVGSQVFMGGDVAPERYESPKGISLSLHLDDVVEAERIFQELARDGRIILPLEKTFWAARFGMVIDRFGMPWLVNCGAPE